MHKPAGYLSKQSKRRIANAKNYLRRLLSAGKYDQAEQYALAQGLTLEPRSQPVTGGAGVDQPPAPGNINGSTPALQNTTKSLLTVSSVDTCNFSIASSSTVLQQSAEGDGCGSLTGTVKAKSVPVLRISDKGVVHREIGKMWYAFASRVRGNRASSVMAWPEYEALEAELGAVGRVASIVEAVTVENGTANVNNPGLGGMGKDDPVGTVVGTVHKEVPNRSMRLVELVGSDEPVVCWVPRGKVPAVGQDVALCPNDDERGGYVMVGEYGRMGGRVR